MDPTVAARCVFTDDMLTAKLQSTDIVIYDGRLLGNAGTEKSWFVCSLILSQLQNITNLAKYNYGDFSQLQYITNLAKYNFGDKDSLH